MKFMILGSNSFAGSSYIDFLLNAGYEVIALSRSDEKPKISLAYGNNTNLHNLKFFKMDLNKNMNEMKRMELIKNLRNVPYDIKKVIEQNNEDCIKVANYLKDHDTIFVLGRGDNYAIALEGSLKIKEISYIHSEGYSASSLKHGPFALLDEKFPVIIFNLDDFIVSYTRKAAYKSPP